jgi:hypothetical protein
LVGNRWGECPGTGDAGWFHPVSDGPELRLFSQVRRLTPLVRRFRPKGDEYVERRGRIERVDDGLFEGEEAVVHLMG